VRQQSKKLGRRPKVSPKTEDAMSAGNGMLKVAAVVGVGSDTVQRVKREMAVVLAEAALPLWDGSRNMTACADRNKQATKKHPDQGGRQSDDPAFMSRPVTVPQNALIQLARRKPR
jgi:hypothetical protein